MTKYIGTKRLGSLNYAGQILAPATRPWLTDLSVLCPYDGLMPGNIPEFERDPDWDKWSLGNSPQDRSLSINWHVFQAFWPVSVYGRYRLGNHGQCYHC